MSRINQNCFIMLLLTLTVSMVGCKYRRSDAASTICDQSCKLNVPQVVFYLAEHDFGRVDMGSQNTYFFEFLNAGGKDLVIENILASCGCTVTKTEKSTIPPGGTSEITVTYRADSFGKSRKRILVSTNDPASPQVELWVAAEVPGSLKSAQTPQPGSISSPRANRPSQGTMSPDLKRALKNLNKATGG